MNKVVIIVFLMLGVATIGGQNSLEDTSRIDQEKYQTYKYKKTIKVRGLGKCPGMPDNFYKAIDKKKYAISTALFYDDMNDGSVKWFPVKEEILNDSIGIERGEIIEVLIEVNTYENVEYEMLVDFLD